jgi:hypothetical protein
LQRFPHYRYHAVVRSSDTRIASHNEALLHFQSDIAHNPLAHRTYGLTCVANCATDRANLRYCKSHVASHDMGRRLQMVSRWEFKSAVPTFHFNPFSGKSGRHSTLSVESQECRPDFPLKGSKKGRSLSPNSHANQGLGIIAWTQVYKAHKPVSFYAVSLSVDRQMTVCILQNHHLTALDDHLFRWHLTPE